MEQKIIQITSGRGPAECAWVVAKVLREFLAELKKKEIEYEVLNRVEGSEKRTLNSVSVMVKAPLLKPYLAAWIGTILWVGKSPYRKFHKRKNWFIGFEVFEIERIDHLNMKDVVFQTMRASGPGGQHVNKVETAVRAVHVPSGTSAVGSDTRSQKTNKGIALGKLKRALEELKMKQLSEVNVTRWGSHNQLKRGNPVRVYRGDDFKLYKTKD